MFPLFLNLHERLCLVVGGGAVGRRKALALLDAGAHVRLVCLEPPAVEMTHQRVQWLQQPYCAEHLHGTTLVFAAAGVEVNRRIVADARAAGLWVNSATEPDCGDFFTPASVRRGDLLIAIGTGGNAPALAGTIRELLETAFDEDFDVWLTLLAELRAAARDAVTDPAPRQELMRRLCRCEWLERLRREGIETVRAAMFAELQALAGPPADQI